jgi:hypothetical protein
LYNKINIEDDYTFGSPEIGYGIFATGSTGNLSISSNTLNARASLPPNAVSLIHCKDNIASSGPYVYCNFLSKSHYGFEFEGSNKTTVWEGNEMCTHWAGLALTNNGFIGTKGSLQLPCENYWSPYCQPWGFGNAPNETYCDNSDPTFSPLYVCGSVVTSTAPLTYSATVGYVPSFNWSVPTWSPAYVSSPPHLATIITTTIHNAAAIDCFLIQGLPAPNWRTSNAATSIAVEDKIFDAASIRIYPNPTNGRLTISTPTGAGDLTLTIRDLTGKIVFTSVLTGGTDGTTDISGLASSIYFVEVRDQENKTVHKKLIKTN